MSVDCKASGANSSSAPASAQYARRVYQSCLPDMFTEADSFVSIPMNDTDQLWKNVIEEIGVDCAVLRYLERVNELFKIHDQDQIGLAEVTEKRDAALLAIKSPAVRIEETTEGWEADREANDKLIRQTQLMEEKVEDIRKEKREEWYENSKSRKLTESLGDIIKEITKEQGVDRNERKKMQEADRKQKIEEQETNRQKRLRLIKTMEVMGKERQDDRKLINSLTDRIKVLESRSEEERAHTSVPPFVEHIRRRAQEAEAEKVNKRPRLTY